MRDSLANAYWKSGDYGRAVTLAQETLAARERLLGAGHPDTCSSRQNLAHAYWKSGDLDRAAALYKETLDHRVELLGDGHPDTLRSRYSLESADFFGQLVGSGEAAVATQLQRLDEADPDALRSGVAHSESATDELARWISMHERTLAERVAALGEEHPDTLWARNRLATVCASAGDIERAVSLYEQTLADRVRVLGEDHPDTKLAGRNLIVARATLDDGRE